MNDDDGVDMTDTRGGRAYRFHERFPNDQRAAKSSGCACTATYARANTTAYDTDPHGKPRACNEDGTHANKKCPKRRYNVSTNDDRCGGPAALRDDGRPGRTRCDGSCRDGRALHSTVLAAVVGWTRAAFDRVLDKKSHIAVAAVFFVLGAFFDDYCNCLYGTGDTESGC